MIAQRWPRPRRGAGGYAETGAFGEERPSLLPGAVELPHKVVNTINGAALVGGIVHPRGTLMWDTGEIPDSAFKDGVSPQKLNNYTVNRPLLPQLAYTPADITYLALSHYHGDHVANASLFARSTWIVQKGDRDPILARGRKEAVYRTRNISTASPTAKRFC
jgi:glyoxylase-like metal-dependent hydrolase (beta-lactamase superfamily II)